MILFAVAVDMKLMYKDLSASHVLRWYAYSNSIYLYLAVT